LSVSFGCYGSSSLTVIVGLSVKVPVSLPSLVQAPFLSSSMARGTAFLPATGSSVERTPLDTLPSADINPSYRQAALTKNTSASIRNNASIKSKRPVILFGRDPSIAPYLISIGPSGVQALGLPSPSMLAVNIEVIKPTTVSWTLAISLLRVACSVTSQMTRTPFSPVKVSRPEAKAAVVLISILFLAVDMPAASESRSAVAAAVMMIFVRIRIRLLAVWLEGSRVAWAGVVRVLRAGSRVRGLGAAAVKGLLSGDMTGIKHAGAGVSVPGFLSYRPRWLGVQATS
jgi:hypothetical protein